MSADSNGGIVPDALGELCRKMTDVQLRWNIRYICGESKRAGSRARPLSEAAVRALAALMAEEARRVRI